MTYDIKRSRAILGVPQEKAAELLGVHRVTYNRWENDAFPFPKSVELACESYLSHYPGNSSNQAKAILALSTICCKLTESSQPPLKIKPSPPDLC